MFYKSIILIVVSAGLVVLSWPSFRKPRSHGFFRFFAFETVLLMALMNADVWFRNPFALLQILSWFFLLISLILAIHGFYMLRTIGQPEGDLESTTQLVKKGAYGYIRHPLYASLLYLGIGVFLKDVSPVGAAMLAALLAFLIATARVEEVENSERFGAAYETYMTETKMFVPFIF